MHDFGLESGATELCFVRHADAKPQDEDANIDVTYRDAQISTLGRAQARALADRFSGERVAAVISSPSLRTMQTAGAIADALGQTVIPDPRLREVEIGEFDRALDTSVLTVAQAVRERLDRLAEIALRDGGWAALAGTEPSLEVRERMRESANAAIATYPGGRVILVSHAGAINAYFADLLGLERDFFFPAGNTSISIARGRDGRRMLVGLNDIAHLRSIVRSA